MYEEKFGLYSGRCMRAKLLQLCLILCDPMNCSLPGSSGHGIHQRSPRILECVAYPFSRGSSQARIELGSPALHVNSLPAELPRYGHSLTILIIFSKYAFNI